MFLYDAHGLRPCRSGVLRSAVQRAEGLVTRTEQEDSADDLSAALSGPPVTRRGELWLLGEHRGSWGSALEKCSYTTLMDCDRADLVFCDPPYNVPKGSSPERNKRTAQMIFPLP